MTNGARGRGGGRSCRANGNGIKLYVLRVEWRLVGGARYAARFNENLYIYIHIYVCIGVHPICHLIANVFEVAAAPVSAATKARGQIEA